MAVEVLTVTLGQTRKIKGKDLISGDEDDNQIVTVLDGGDLRNSYVFEFWGKGTPTEPGAGPGGDDEFHFDLSGFDDDFSISIKSFDEGDCFSFTNFDSYSVVGNTYTFQYTGSDGQPHTVSIDAESTNGTGVACVMVCFVRGSRIRTPAGPMAVEDLNAGDQVICGDGQSREIRWVGGRKLSDADLMAHPDLKPVRFGRNAIAPGQPDAPLFLSPQHRVLLRDWRAELLFGDNEVLAAAKSLVNDTDIRVQEPCGDVEYFHILLDGHHTVFANGVECETLMPAELMRNALPAKARDEIAHIFPDLVGNLASFGQLYRRALKPFEVNALRMS